MFYLFQFTFLFFVNIGDNVCIIIRSNANICTDWLRRVDANAFTNVTNAVDWKLFMRKWQIHQKDVTLILIEFCLSECGKTNEGIWCSSRAYDMQLLNIP